jgi:hypothetical protein
MINSSWKIRMKQTIKFLAMAIALSFTVQDAYAQGNSSNNQPKDVANDLKGLWLINYGRTLQGIAGQGKPKYDKMSTRSKDSMRKSFENRTFNFEDNKIVSIKFTSNEKQQNVNGQWTYNHNDNSLTITAAGISRNYIVAWEDKNRICLTFKETSSEGMLNNLYLTRKNQ